MNTELIAKIEKLLALAGSANEHEARAASAKAAELLTKYNLDAGAIAGERYTMGVFWEGIRFSPAHKWLYPIIQRFFFVHPIRKEYARGKWRLEVIGAETNVTVAGYVYNFLLRAYRRLWREYRLAHPRRKPLRSSYYFGVSAGIVSRLMEQRETTEREAGRKVGEDPNLEKYVDALYPDRERARPRKPPRFNTAAESGSRDGRKVRIHKAVEGPAEQSGRMLR